MTKELVISTNRHETKLALLEDGQLVEVFFQRANEYSLVGSIHKGRVTRVLPGMQSAFVNIGLERDAFLYVSDFYEETGEDYERVGSDDHGRRGRGDRQDRSDASEGSERGERGGRGDRGGRFGRSERTERPEGPVTAAASTEGGNGESAVSATSAPGNERGEYGDRRGGRRSRRRRRGPNDRGFPENKFARPAETAAEPVETFASATEAEVEDEPLVLPGESLAKYRGRPASERDEDENGDDAQMASLDSEVVAEHDEDGPTPMSEDEVTEAIEAAVEARLEEYGDEPEEAEAAEEAAEELDEADEAREPADASFESAEGDVAEDILAAADEDDDDPEAEPFARPTHDPFDDAEEVQAAAEESDETEIEASGEVEGETAGEPSEASAELREQPAARYIQPRSGGRMRRRGRRGGRRDDRGGDRPERGSAPPVERNLEGALDPAPDAMPEGRSVEQREGRPQREGGERGERRGGRDRVERERPPLPLITDLLKEGQEIIVQIAKEPLGQKGARITSHVAIPGRYVVFMPTLDHNGVSRKVGTDDERIRLKRILSAHSQGMTGGFIVRTAGEGKPESEIAADMQFLHNLWLDIRKKAEKRPAPALLHHDLELVQRTLRDQVSDNFKAVWVDNEETFESILGFLERFQPAMVSRVKLWTRSIPIFDAFKITDELDKALRPKVWLKSGGYIVINQTEALVAIDVNTGKYVGKSNRLEDTIVKTNTEAVKEIARQIRLRDLGGIIVVDFIDMDERRNRQKVMQALEEAMRTDRAPYKILQFNDFGLVAITRRRVKQSLERALCQPCTTCEGSGYIKSSGTVMSEIITEAHKLAPALEGKEVVLRVHPDVANVIKSAENHYLEELEEILGRPVLVTADGLIHPEKFDMA